MNSINHEVNNETIIKINESNMNIEQPLKHWHTIRAARISFKINLLNYVQYLFWFLFSLHVIVSYTVF